MNIASWQAPAGTWIAPYDPATVALMRSRLLLGGGFWVIPQLFRGESLLAMFYEALRRFPGAIEERREGEDREDWRGGLPPRQLLSAGGGPVQDCLYQAPALQALLSTLIGVPVRPSGNRGSYSYYCRPGDHLALHRDVEGCDVSVIVVISDNTHPDQSGGELVLYPDRIHEPLSAIRQEPNCGKVTLKLAAGETLIVAGGMVPHFVGPVAPGQYRITAPLCFQIVPG